MAFLLHFLRSDDLFVDIGANVGSYTILACSAIGATGMAFEPVPSTHKRLVDNLRLNHVDQKVQCFHIALGSEKGQISFAANQDVTNHVLASGEHCPDSVTVEVDVLDAYLQNKEPALIKIDVEGFETAVLQGAQQTLTNPALHCLIMELNSSGNRYGFNELNIIETMRVYDFAPYAYDPFSRSLTPLEGKNINEGNTLFIRHKSFVQDRVQNAPPVNVLGVHF
jgi:FkbM family methyltransferase